MRRDKIIYETPTCFPPLGGEADIPTSASIKKKKKKKRFIQVIIYILFLCVELRMCRLEHQLI